MFKRLVRNRRAVAMAMSAMFVATAFSPSGCTITVDEDLVQQVLDWASDFDSTWESSGSWDCSGTWGGGGCDDPDSSAYVPVWQPPGADSEI